MSSIIRSELVNYNNLVKLAFTPALLNNEWMKTNKEYTKECYGKIGKMLSKCQTYNERYGKIPTIYTDTADRRYTRGISLQTIDATIRNLLINDFCFDVDIVNSCPSILNSLTKGKFPKLNYYCKNRKEVIESISNEFKKYNTELNRGQVKQLFQCLLFGGSINTWLTDNNLNGFTHEDYKFQYNKKDIDDEQFEYINDFALESRNIQNYLWKNADSYNIQALKNEIESMNKTNKKGSFLAKSAYLYERKCIDILENNLKDSDFQVNAIVHDGLNVYHNSFQKNTVIKSELNKIIENVENDIKKGLDFDIKLICKEMETYGVDLSKYSVNTQAMKQFDLQFMSRLESYETMKTYFEMFFGFVKAAGVYYEKSYKYCFQYELSKLNEIINGANCKIEKKNAKGEMVEKWVPFLKLYKSDTTRKMYDKVGVYLGADIEKYSHENNFNIHIPLPEIPNKPENHDIYVKHFKKLIGYALGDENDNKGFVNYMIQWLADMIQNPTNKGTSTSVIISGDQGSGKSSITEILTWIFGKDKILSEASGKVLYDVFNGYLMGKMLFNLEESEEGCDLTGRIKNFTTSNTWHYEFKNKNKVSAPNYTRLLFVSNKKVPVFIDSLTGERRFVVFDSFKPNDKTMHFFESFYEAYGSEGEHHKSFCDSIYHLLATYNITIKNFQKERPVTKAYRKLMMRCVNKKIQFMINFIETCQFDQDEEDITFIGEQYPEYWKSKNYEKQYITNKTSLFEKFKEYIEEEYNLTNKKLNKSEFYNDLESHFGIVEKRTNKGRQLQFIPSEIMKVCKNKNWLLEYHGQEIKAQQRTTKYKKSHLLDF